MRSPPRIVVEDKPSPADVAFVEERINEFNFATTGYRDGGELACFVRDDGRRDRGRPHRLHLGRLLPGELPLGGGVATAARGSGQRTASRPRRRRPGVAAATLIHLDTHDFQAPTASTRGSATSGSRTSPTSRAATGRAGTGSVWTAGGSARDECVRRPRPSVRGQQAAEPAARIADPGLAERLPVERRVAGDDRPRELLLQLVDEVEQRQPRADLRDRLGLGKRHLAADAADLRRLGLADRVEARAGETADRDDREAVRSKAARTCSFDASSNGVTTAMRLAPISFSAACAACDARGTRDARAAATRRQRPAS